MSQFVDGDLTKELRSSEEVPRLLNILRWTTVRKANYNAARFPAGYHTWVFSSDNEGKKVYKGERNPLDRLNALQRGVGYDFKGKVVVDIGCNQGGMLLPLADKILCGVGFDINCDLVNCANRMAVHFNRRNLSFYTYDIDAANLQISADTLAYGGFARMLDFLPYNRPDIIFLLAVCQWVKHWRELLCWCSKTAPCLFFEDNGNRDQQRQHREVLAELYGNVIDLRYNERGRRLFFCSR